MSRAGAASTALMAAVALAACTSVSPTPSSSADPSATASSAQSGRVDPSTSPARAASAAAAAAWQQLPDAPFARLEMGVAAHDGRIWMAGGLSPFGEALTDVEIYDPSSGEWTDGPALPASVHHAALVSDGDRLLLIGGYLGSAFNRPTDIVLALDDEDGEWVAGPTLPAPRAAGAAAWDGARVVYAGGIGDGVSGDVYALAGDGWEAIGVLAEPREHLAATSDLAGRTWLLGGRVGGLNGNLGTVELVDGETIELLGGLPTPRGGVAAFHVDGVGACLTGGEAPDRAYTTVECMAADGTITTLPELRKPHHGHGAAVVDGVAHVLLGGPEPALSAGATVETLALDAIAP